MAKTDDYWSDADMVSVIRYLRRNKALQVPDEIKPLLGMAGWCKTVFTHRAVSYACPQKEHCNTGPAMSIHKRLRSLASELWDTDSDLLDTPLFAVGEPSKRNQCGSCCLAETTIKKQFEVELDGLRQTILQLEAEKLDLRDRIQKLKDDLSSTTLQLFEVQNLWGPLEDDLD